MPIDGAGYLTSRGWAGKGTALRAGGLSRPLAIPQKRTLSGVGKDRDEAFPFWDHVYAAAANTIKIKIQDGEQPNSNTDLSADEEENVSQPLRRTTTGIISNRRPISGAPIISATDSSFDTLSSNGLAKISVMALAKRESARRLLYARFFRGPILHSIDPPSSPKELPQSGTNVTSLKGKKKHKQTTNLAGDDFVEKKEKKRKLKSEDHSVHDEPRLKKKKRKRDTSAIENAGSSEDRGLERGWTAETKKQERRKEDVRNGKLEVQKSRKKKAAKGEGLMEHNPALGLSTEALM